MKSRCEGCGGSLNPASETHVRPDGGTLCPSCFVSTHQHCPHCGGELVRKRDTILNGAGDEVPDAPPPAYRRGLVWAISFGVWTFVALAGTLTVWQIYRSSDTPMRFMTTVWLQLSQTLTYAPLTPFVFALAIRYPMRRDKWLQRSLLYLAAGFAFSVAHIALRAVTPYAIWDQKQHQWAWAYGMQTLIFSKSPGLRFEPYFSTTSWTTLPEPLLRFC